MKRRLPVIDDSFLDQIEIAKPCDADWEQMAGDERVRHCGDCRLNVYDVSQMTRKEAAALILAGEDKGERPCLRLYRRPDGRLLTQDCWERLRAARRRGWVAFAAALVIVGLTQLGLRFAGIKWLLDWQQQRAAITNLAPPTVAPPAVEAPAADVPPVIDAPQKGQGQLPPRQSLMGGARRPTPPSKPPSRLDTSVKGKLLRIDL